MEQTLERISDEKRLEISTSKITSKTDCIYNKIVNCLILVRIIIRESFLTSISVIFSKFSYDFGQLVSPNASR